MAAYWSVQAILAYVLGLLLLAPLGDEEGILMWFGPLLLMFGAIFLQWVFLLPIRKPSHSTRRTPILLSIAVGALYASILLTVFAIAINYTLETYDLMALDYGDLPELLFWVIILAATWTVSTPLLIAFCRNTKDPTFTQQFASRLFLGSIIEAAAIIPLDILVRRKEDCICATATFFSLAICCSVGVAVFGPAIFLPLTLRHRKRWYGRQCDACGYNMRGNTAAQRCPECGAGWRTPKQHKPPPPPNE